MSNDINLEIIKTEKDVLVMLDEFLEKRDSEWWNEFYSNKNKPIPFFKNIPDENIISYLDKGILNGGRALDIGCGKGRNSICLAQNGFDVLGIDFSETSIEMSKEQAKQKDFNLSFLCKSIFDFQGELYNYDFIYDSGCFHHIKPHRREEYLKTVLRYLKPNGYFSMICFNLKGGANMSDYDVYRDNSMHGGIGFSEYKLRTILETYFEIIEFREMKKTDNEEVFGENFLWTVLMKKKQNK